MSRNKRTREMRDEQPLEVLEYFQNSRKNRKVWPKGKTVEAEMSGIPNYENTIHQVEILEYFPTSDSYKCWIKSFPRNHPASFDVWKGYMLHKRRGPDENFPKRIGTKVHIKVRRRDELDNDHRIWVKGVIIGFKGDKYRVRLDSIGNPKKTVSPRRIRSVYKKNK